MIGIKRLNFSVSSVLIILAYLISAIVLTVVSNYKTITPIQILSIMIVGIIVPIVYSLCSLKLHKREKTVTNLTMLAKILAISILLIFSLYIFVAAILAILTLFNILPLASLTSNPIVYFFVFWIILSLFSTLFLIFLITIYKTPRAFLSIVAGLVLALYIIMGSHQQLANTLGFLLIILGVFITAIPSLLTFYPKIKNEQIKIEEGKFNSRLFIAEFYLIISFVIFLFSYLIIANSNIPIAALSLSSIRVIWVILGIGLTFLFGGLIFLLETLIPVFLKI